MLPTETQVHTRRFQNINVEKAYGKTYTPHRLAQFVAEKIVENADLKSRVAIRILDPAIGDGVLTLALLRALKKQGQITFSVYAFDINASALKEAEMRICSLFPEIHLKLYQKNFLEYVLEPNRGIITPSLFSSTESRTFDLIIANPPYVRTQIMGARQAHKLASTFGLSGRVDLYQAFLIGMAQVLAPDGTIGVIVSNRFMTTKSGNLLRNTLRKRLNLRHIWDLGDTKLFDAAILPAIIIARGSAIHTESAPLFTSIYEARKSESEMRANDPITALAHEGIVEVDDGRRFRVQHGNLDCSGTPDDIWRLISKSGDNWIKEVMRHTWKRFGEIWKIRVGVKTCADKIFIRHDWDILGEDKPELLRKLTTHHNSGRFRAVSPKKVRAILYPHEVVEGYRQAIPLDKFPKSRAYLESHRAILEGRSYLIEAGRRWYELWVPQDPEVWDAPKLVFRDISERPTFWIDLDGSIVNGDCYWFTASNQEEIDLLWLAVAVANSTFAESFYDRCFNNKLYAGRRRFITQYVEQFPLPNPILSSSKEIIKRSKEIYDADHASETINMEMELDKLVWLSFGLNIKEVVG